jgi:hypothetical protein
MCRWLQLRTAFFEDKKNYGDVTRVFSAVNFFGDDSDMETVAKAGSDAQVNFSPILELDSLSY